MPIKSYSPRFDSPATELSSACYNCPIPAAKLPGKDSVAIHPTLTKVQYEDLLYNRTSYCIVHTRLYVLLAH